MNNQKSEEAMSESRHLEEAQKIVDDWSDNYQGTHLEFSLKMLKQNFAASLLLAEAKGMERAAVIAEKGEVFYSPHAKDSDKNLKEWIISVKYQIAKAIRAEAMKPQANKIETQEMNRCPVCNWPLAESVEKGCVVGNCSMRQKP